MTEWSIEKQSKIVDEILNERKKQDIKWGQQNHNNATWNLILSEEVGEVAKSILEARFGNARLEETREELIQVAAVALAWLECIDHRE